MGFMIMVGGTALSQAMRGFVRVISDFDQGTALACDSLSNFFTSLEPLIELLDEPVKRHKGWWFVPEQPKVVKVIPMNSIIRTERQRGSGWKRDRGHFILKLC